MRIDYTISRIYASDIKGNRLVDALLQAEGISRDQNLDYTCGIFDANGSLIATGSCFGNTLRCLAVDSAHQGEGLMNAVVTHLTEIQFARENTRLFLYTKCSSAKFFRIWDSMKSPGLQIASFLWRISAPGFRIT